MTTKLTVTIKTDTAGKLFIGTPTMEGDGLPVPLACDIFGALAEIQDNYNIEHGFTDVNEGVKP